MYYRGSDKPELAITEFQKAAKKNDVLGIVNLATLLLVHNKLDSDPYEKAKKLFLKALALGDESEIAAGSLLAMQEEDQVSLTMAEKFTVAVGLMAFAKNDPSIEKKAAVLCNEAMQEAKVGGIAFSDDSMWATRDSKPLKRPDPVAQLRQSAGNIL